MALESDQNFGIEPNPGTVAEAFAERAALEAGIDELTSSPEMRGHLFGVLARGIPHMLNLKGLLAYQDPQRGVYAAADPYDPTHFSGGPEVLDDLIEYLDALPARPGSEELADAKAKLTGALPVGSGRDKAYVSALVRDLETGKAEDAVRKLLALRERVKEEGGGTPVQEASKPAKGPRDAQAMQAFVSNFTGLFTDAEEERLAHRGGVQTEEVIGDVAKGLQKAMPLLYSAARLNKIDTNGPGTAESLLSMLFNDLDARYDWYGYRFRRAGNRRGVNESGESQMAAREKRTAYVTLYTFSLMMSRGGKDNLENIREMVRSGIEGRLQGKEEDSRLRLKVTDNAYIWGVAPMGRESSVAAIESIGRVSSAKGAGASKSASDLMKLSPDERALGIARIAEGKRDEFLTSEAVQGLKDITSGYGRSLKGIPSDELASGVRHLMDLVLVLSKKVDDACRKRLGELVSAAENGAHPLDTAEVGQEIDKTLAPFKFRNKAPSEAELSSAATKFDRKIGLFLRGLPGRVAKSITLEALAAALLHFMRGNKMLGVVSGSEDYKGVVKALNTLKTEADRIAESLLAVSDPIGFQAGVSSFLSEIGTEALSGRAHDARYIESGTKALAEKYTGPHAYWGHAEDRESGDSVDTDYASSLSDDLRALAAGQLDLAHHTAVTDPAKGSAGLSFVDSFLHSAASEGSRRKLEQFFTEFRGTVPTHAVAQDITVEDFLSQAKLLLRGDKGTLERLDSKDPESAKAVSQLRDKATGFLKHLASSQGYDGGTHHDTVATDRLLDGFADLVEQKLGTLRPAGADSVAEALREAVKDPKAAPVLADDDTRSSIIGHIDDISVRLFEKFQDAQAGDSAARMDKSLVKDILSDYANGHASAKKGAPVSPNIIYVAGDNITLVPGKEYELVVGDRTQPLNDRGPRSSVTLRVLGGAPAVSRPELALGIGTLTDRKGNRVPSSEIPKFLEFAARTLGNDKERFRGLAHTYFSGWLPGDSGVGGEEDQGDPEDDKSESTDAVFDTYQKRNDESVDQALIRFMKHASPAETEKVMEMYDRETEGGLSSSLKDAVSRLPPALQKELLEKAKRVFGQVSGQDAKEDDMEEKADTLRQAVLSSLPTLEDLLPSLTGLPPEQFIEAVTGTREFAEPLVESALKGRVLNDRVARDHMIKATLVKLFRSHPDLNRAYLDAQAVEGSDKARATTTEVDPATGGKREVSTHKLYREHGFGQLSNHLRAALNYVKNDISGTKSVKLKATVGKEVKRFFGSDPEAANRLFSGWKESDPLAGLRDPSSLTSKGGVRNKATAKAILHVGQKRRIAQEALTSFGDLSHSLYGGSGPDKDALSLLNRLKENDTDLFLKLFRVKPQYEDMVKEDPPGVMASLPPLFVEGEGKGTDRYDTCYEQAVTNLDQVPGLVADGLSPDGRALPGINDYLSLLHACPTLRSFLEGLSEKGGKKEGLTDLLDKALQGDKSTSKDVVADVEERLGYGKNEDSEAEGSQFEREVSRMVHDHIREAIQGAMKVAHMPLVEKFMESLARQQRRQGLKGVKKGLGDVKGLVDHARKLADRHFIDSNLGKNTRTGLGKLPSTQEHDSKTADYLDKILSGKLKGYEGLSPALKKTVEALADAPHEAPHEHRGVLEELKALRAGKDVKKASDDLLMLAIKTAYTHIEKN